MKVLILCWLQNQKLCYRIHHYLWIEAGASLILLKNHSLFAELCLYTVFHNKALDSFFVADSGG